MSQGGGEGRGPGPVLGQAEFVAAAVVDEAAWHGEEPVGDGGRVGELARGVGAAEAGGPAGEVVREHAAGEPGAVGEEPRPEGQRLSPALSLRSLMARSTVAWARW